MAQANGPFLPKSGWMKRWTIQGAQVLSRSPEAILVIVATVLVAGYVSRVLNDAALELTGLAIFGLTVSSVATIPIGMAGAMLSLNALRYADRGEWSKPNELLAAGIPAILSVTKFIAVLALAMMAIILPAELLAPPEAGAASTSPAPGFFASLLIRGAADVSTSIGMGLILHPFAIGAVVLRGMASDTLRANAAMLKARDVRTYFNLMATVFAGHLLISLLPPILQLPSLALYIAWFYIGAREVIDGDDQNGHVQAATKTASGTA